MELDQVASFFDFRVYLKQVVDSAESFRGSLEDYLRAVLRLVIAHADSEFTWKLQARILSDGLTGAPLDFDESWMAFNGPGELVSVNSGSELQNEYEALLGLLKYQIADLRRLEVAGELNSPYRHMGLNSPSGYAWYTFTPEDFLGQALQWLLGGTEDTTFCSWHDLGILLWLGQIYE